VHVVELAEPEAVTGQIEPRLLERLTDGGVPQRRVPGLAPSPGKRDVAGPWIVIVQRAEDEENFE
jgi:hypothetical protein